MDTTSKAVREIEQKSSFIALFVDGRLTKWTNSQYHPFLKMTGDYNNCG
jgi:hypothetical protein